MPRMMTGQSELALKHIRQMVAEMPQDFLKENATAAEGFVAMPLEVLVRFGRWDEILREPDNYPDYMPFTRAFHQARARDRIRREGRFAEARARSRRALRERAAAGSEGDYPRQQYRRSDHGRRRRMLEGEILVAEGKLDEGLARADGSRAKLEDALKYDEPPGWMIPVRHVIGATLMRAGRFADAEQVYREDLRRLPDNGWSLYGLSESMRRAREERRRDDGGDAGKIPANLGQS